MPDRQPIDLYADELDLATGATEVATVDAARRRPTSRAITTTAVALAIILASAGVLVGARLLMLGSPQADSRVPASTLDANAASATGSAPVAGAVPGSTRLVMLGPVPLVDDAAGAAAPGAEVRLPLPVLPDRSTAVLLEVSLDHAAGPGVVTVSSTVDKATVLRLPAAGAMTGATAVVGIDSDRELRVRTEGGGRLLVNLVGAFEPAATSTAGRIVPVAPTQVLHLVPKTDGKNAFLDLRAIRPLADRSVSGVLLQMSADVGRNGGFVAVGPAPNALNQRVPWMATSGSDRVRTGLLVVGTAGGKVYLHYEAGTELTVDLVGYVTGDNATPSAAGLVVPVAGAAAQTARIPAGGQADIRVLPPNDLDRVPSARVAAALLQVSATGDAFGRIVVHPVDVPAPALSTLDAGAGLTRATSVLVSTVDATVRVDSTAGAAVSLTPQLLILTA